MREMVLKNLVSPNKRRRELFVSESYRDQGISQKLEKKTIYVVKEVLEITSDFDLQLFINRRRKEGKLKPKQTFVTRVSNNNNAQEKIFYKIYGDSYAVIDDKLFIIKLIQHIQIEFIKSSV